MNSKPVRNHKPWTPWELAKLRTFYNMGLTDSQIGKRFARSASAISNKRIKILTSFIICIDCEIKVKIIKGKRLRCDPCSEIHTKKQHKITNAKWYQENLDYEKQKRDFVRFSGFREKVIQRDNEMCQICGTTREEHYLEYGCDITVHNIDKNGRGSKDRNHSMEKLITLCKSCIGTIYVGKRVQDWSMCRESLLNYWKKQHENTKKSVIMLLNEGKRPDINRSGKIYWN